jgi:hypothetical protein
MNNNPVFFLVAAFLNLAVVILCYVLMHLTYDHTSICISFWCGFVNFVFFIGNFLAYDRIKFQELKDKERRK